jgi:hypothetical protein
MTRIDWTGIGERYFETGIDRGVLYVGDNPGVPWIGLVNVQQNQSGGEPNPRYLDGVKISNRTSPEEFEATIEAYTYPSEFEQCDGTLRLDNSLRVSQQKRKTFGLVYRSKVGNDNEGVDHAYKIHIIYNAKAEPSDRGYQTLSNEIDPIVFDWSISTRAVMVNGVRPVSHFVADSRDVPKQLMDDLEDLLYGTELTNPTLPTPGELIFMFDSFEDLVYDAGDPYTPIFVTYDAGTPDDTYDNTIDGGAL